MESHCKLNDKTGRCVINSDPSVTEDDPMCYKTDKNRCAVMKKKVIKIKILCKARLKFARIAIRACLHSRMVHHAGCRE